MMETLHHAPPLVAVLARPRPSSLVRIGLVSVALIATADHDELSTQLHEDLCGLHARPARELRVRRHGRRRGGGPDLRSARWLAVGPVRPSPSDPAAVAAVGRARVPRLLGRSSISAPARCCGRCARCSRPSRPQPAPPRWFRSPNGCRRSRARRAASVLIYASSIAVFGGSTQFMTAWLTRLTGDPLVPAWYLLGVIIGVHRAVAAAGDLASARHAE